MSTLDIRSFNTAAIDEIRFDNSADTIKFVANGLYLNKDNEGMIHLAEWKDVDNFIKACKKAKQLFED